MVLFYRKDDMRQEPVPQGTNAWVNYPDADHRMPGMFAATATLRSGQGHNFHHHPGREEIIYVVEGAITQWIGRECQVLHAGDVALIPSGAVHASFNVSSDPAVLFVVLTAAVSEAPLAVDVANEEPWRSLTAP